VTPWSLVATAPLPGGGELRLLERAGDFSLRAGRRELMSSRVHASEEALGELAAARLARPDARVLLGGLGMGYTLAALLRRLGPQASVLVAELVPAVIEWNRGALAHLAGRPLGDARVSVRSADVAEVIREARAAFDAVLLDVDNGPEGPRRGRGWIYGAEGLRAACAALREGGVLAVWSAGPDRAFARRLRDAGLRVEEHRVRARSGGRGASHVVWIAARHPLGTGGRSGRERAGHGASAPARRRASARRPW
jgi:spermidine synthase